MASNKKYTTVAILLHWLVGLMILGMFALGWYMSDLPKDMAKVPAVNLFDLGLYTVQLAEPVSLRSFYFNLHKSFGVTVLVLIGLRVLWRITHRPPEMPASMSLREIKISTGVHHLLYLLMVAMPVSGLIMAAYSKYGVKWFGASLIAGLDNNPMREIFKEVHENIGWVLIVLIGLHVLAALKHKFINKDDVLKRMSLR